MVAVTNDHKLHSLKQHKTVISQLLQVKHPGTVRLDSLLRASQGWNQGVLQDLGLLWCWVRLPSLPTVGRIEFLVVIGLRSSFSWWPSTGGHSQQLEATHIPCHKASSTFKPGTENFFHVRPPCALTLDFLFCQQLKNILCFGRTHLTRLGLTWIISLS